jgi:hypothetical protein
MIVNYNEYNIKIRQSYIFPNLHRTLTVVRNWNRLCYSRFELNTQEIRTDNALGDRHLEDRQKDKAGSIKTDLMYGGYEDAR